jgi:hypothetical protein
MFMSVETRLAALDHAMNLYQHGESVMGSITQTDPVAAVLKIAKQFETFLDPLAIGDGVVPDGPKITSPFAPAQDKAA